MKLILDIKDHKIEFFLELLSTFKDFVQVEPVSEGLSDEEKSFIDGRLAAYEANPDQLVGWEQLAESVQNLPAR